jgi:hypothetical protein
MAQVINPADKREDGLGAILGGLQVYSTVTGMQNDAMKRRLEKEKPASMPMAVMSGVANGSGQ